MYTRPTSLPEATFLPAEDAAVNAHPKISLVRRLYQRRFRRFAHQLSLSSLLHIALINTNRINPPPSINSVTAKLF